MFIDRSLLHKQVQLLSLSVSQFFLHRQPWCHLTSQLDTTELVTAKTSTNSSGAFNPLIQAFCGLFRNTLALRCLGNPRLTQYRTPCRSVWFHPFLRNDKLFFLHKGPLLLRFHGSITSRFMACDNMIITARNNTYFFLSLPQICQMLGANATDGFLSKEHIAPNPPIGDILQKSIIIWA
jgi:hypothetical protein